jgi:hypothetical protein
MPDPLDARAKDVYDEAFEEGVGNWNMLVLQGKLKGDPAFAIIAAQSPAALAAYAREPYLGLLTTDQVFERYRMLLVATTPMDRDGFIDPRSAAPIFQEKLVHAAAELALRGQSLTDSRATPDFTFCRTPAVLKAMEAMKRRTRDWGPHLLVKYGATGFLRPALEQGIFRLAPAHFYSDPSLSPAQRDDELERSLVDAATDLRATLGQIGDTLSSEKKADFGRTVRSAVDYYVLCLSGDWDLRLFDDFKADAALVITDASRFARDLGEAAARVLPEWEYDCRFVIYIDPVQRLDGFDEKRQLDFAPFFCKHLRYWYQKEVRAVWLPPDPKQPPTRLEPIFVTIGSIEEYSELIEL